MVFMAVFSSSSRTLAWGSPASCVDLSRITLTTTSARPLGKFSSVLPIHLSSFLSTQRGHSVWAFGGVRPGQGDSVPTVKTWTQLRDLGGVSGLPVPAVPSTLRQPPSLLPRVVSLISKCVILQITPTLFPDGSRDLGRSGTKVLLEPACQETWERVHSQQSRLHGSWADWFSFPGLIQCRLLCSNAWEGEGKTALLPSALPRPPDPSLGTWEHFLFTFSLLRMPLPDVLLLCCFVGG